MTKKSRKRKRRGSLNLIRLPLRFQRRMKMSQKKMMATRNLF